MRDRRLRSYAEAYMSGICDGQGNYTGKYACQKLMRKMPLGKNRYSRGGEHERYLSCALRQLSNGKTVVLSDVVQVCLDAGPCVCKPPILRGPFHRLFDAACAAQQDEIGRA